MPVPLRQSSGKENCFQFVLTFIPRILASVFCAARYLNICVRFSSENADSSIKISRWRTFTEYISLLVTIKRDLRSPQDSTVLVLVEIWAFANLFESPEIKTQAKKIKLKIKIFLILIARRELNLKTTEVVMLWIKNRFHLSRQWLFLKHFIIRYL